MESAHERLLVWLYAKIRVTEIDRISYVRDNPKLDKDLQKIVIAQGPCGRSFNLNVQCPKDTVYCKRFPRHFLRNTQIGNDGYSLYRRKRFKLNLPSKWRLPINLRR